MCVATVPWLVIYIDLLFHTINVAYYRHSKLEVSSKLLTTYLPPPAGMWHWKIGDFNAIYSEAENICANKPSLDTLRGKSLNIFRNQPRTKVLFLSTGEVNVLNNKSTRKLAKSGVPCFQILDMVYFRLVIFITYKPAYKLSQHLVLPDFFQNSKVKFFMNTAFICFFDKIAHDLL